MGKVKIAVRLREETLVTMAWIAERLQMGSAAHVNTPCACEVAIVLTTTPYTGSLDAGS